MKRLFSQARHGEFINAIPLRRMGTVDDIGQTAVFLASPLASYISGCVVVVDGGQNLAGSALFNMGANRCFAPNRGAFLNFGAGIGCGIDLITCRDMRYARPKDSPNPST
jgi:Enoyl-(Acyl carrier protein) reductase